MKAIVAVDEKWAIGLENQLLFSIPTDTKFFRSKTINKVVVMGHSTLNSFPEGKPLEQRTNVVLSRNQQLEIPGAVVCHSLEELTLYLQQFSKEEILIVGGESIYRQLLPYCSAVYVTKIQATRPADSHFPNLDNNPNWELVSTSPPEQEGQLTFTFTEYKNKQVKSLEAAFIPHSLRVRNVEFGTGMPKICIPLTSSLTTELVKECGRALVDGADLVEWRADFFEHLLSPESLTDTLEEIRAAVGNLPLLFTVRTKEEGGNASLALEEYKSIVATALLTGHVDIIDLEFSKDKEVLRELIALAKEQGARVLLSSHNFSKTPPKDELVSLLLDMQDFGADLPKVAVYPQNRKDVLTLLQATEEFSQQATTPFVTLSMSWLGSISRVAGEFFGSAITFGAGVNASAPGQIDAVKLRKVLETLEEPEGELLLL